MAPPRLAFYFGFTPGGATSIDQSGIRPATIGAVMSGHEVDGCGVYNAGAEADFQTSYHPAV